MHTTMFLTNTIRIEFDERPPAITIRDTVNGDEVVLHLPQTPYVRRQLLERLGSDALAFSRRLGPAPDPTEPKPIRTFVAPELHEPGATAAHMALHHSAAFQPRHDADSHGDAMSRSLAAGDHFAGMPDDVVIPFLDRNRPDVGAGE